MPEDQVPEGTARPQVLVGDMSELLADLVRQALDGADVEVVESPAAFRATSPDNRPPIAILATADEGGPWNREWLLARPETIILGVDRQGRRLGVSVLWPYREEAELTSDSLLAAIVMAPTWTERFG